ncbi:NAD(P)-dependent alcohol dehydrogenase [Nakamurella sp.]|uniref:NAD(P)-dependent alcohol dehydrogenase n=1 Tax=Nakamurella sp. TaxID=1869182 RepID=UPI00378380ED
MKAIVQHRYGGPETLEVAEIEPPTVGPNDVRVRVRAAAVDAGVRHLMTGTPWLVRPVMGWRGPRQRVPGIDAAGTVEAVGRDVTDLRPGDPVAGGVRGAYAELCAAKRTSWVRIPDGVSFEEAAAVPTSGSTALIAVRDTARIAAGQRVLITGAGSGVGTYAVQLATRAGATVTGVCRPSKTEIVRDLGADQVVGYEYLAGTRNRYDAVIDIAGNTGLAGLRRLLAPKGTAVLVGGEGKGGLFAGFDRQLRALFVSPFVGVRLKPLAVVTRSADVEQLLALVAGGELRPVIDRTFGIGEVADALAVTWTGAAAGKVIITM